MTKGATVIFGATKQGQWRLEIRLFLAAFAAAGIVFLVTGVNVGTTATMYLAELGFFCLLGCAGVVETGNAIATLLHIKGLRWIGAACFAALLYGVRISSLALLNKVFAVDPSALPLATVAVMAMHLAELLKAPLVLSFVLSFLVISSLIVDARKSPPSGMLSNLFDRLEGLPESSTDEADAQAASKVSTEPTADHSEVKPSQSSTASAPAILVGPPTAHPPSAALDRLRRSKKVSETDETPEMALARIDAEGRLAARVAKFFSFGLACLLALTFIHFRLGSNFNAAATKIALSTDFSERFQCEGYSDKDYRALFIGPEQGRALFVRRERRGASEVDNASRSERDASDSTGGPFDGIFSGKPTPEVSESFVHECSPPNARAVRPNGIAQSDGPIPVQTKQAQAPARSSSSTAVAKRASASSSATSEPTRSVASPKD